MRAVRTIAGVLLSTGVAVGVAAQTGRQNNPPLAIESLYGRDLFQFYCAPCHGPDGKGAGPVARALKTPPSDLTSIARRNSGVFPAARVESFVTDGSDPSSAHGTKEMPVWGPIFRGLDPSDIRVKIRISNLVAYLEAMQSK